MAFPSLRYVGQSNSSHTSTPSIPKPPQCTLLPNFSHFCYHMIYNRSFPTQLLLHHKKIAKPLTLTVAEDRLSLYIITFKVDRVWYCLCTSLDGICQMNVFYSLLPFMTVPYKFIICPT